MNDEDKKSFQKGYKIGYKTGLRDGYTDGVKECDPYMRVWISVQEKLPPKWRKVLVYAKYFECYQDNLNEHGLWQNSDPQATVTHWMEMPEPPK